MRGEERETRKGEKHREKDLCVSVHLCLCVCASVCSCVCVREREGVYVCECVPDEAREAQSMREDVRVCQAKKRREWAKEDKK